MGKKGAIRRFFAGGNTPEGFYSFYSQITPPDSNKIFVLKGGPGVGKSTFMRRIGEELVERGYDVEMLHCSSDPGSLDGLRVPAVDVTLIDGTAPHVVDPRNPGAVDEIVHLGDYWDEAALRANRDHIIGLNREIGRLFARAYDNLRAAKAFYDELETYSRLATNPHWLNAKAEDLRVEIFGSKRLNRAGRERHLFGGAITPEGPMNFLDSLVGPVTRRYIWTGAPGTGKTPMIRKLAEAAVQKGYFVEFFHCPMNPSRVDHAVIPELNVALISSIEPHVYATRLGDVVIDTDAYTDQSLLEPHREDMAAAEAAYKAALNRGVGFLKRAKAAHDRLESYYVPNIRFDQVEERRRQVLDRILELSEERKPAGVAD
ncbi:MAG: PRK06851 family protein [Bacillota bacterium]